MTMTFRGEGWSWKVVICFNIGREMISSIWIVDSQAVPEPWLGASLPCVDTFALVVVDNLGLLHKLVLVDRGPLPLVHIVVPLPPVRIVVLRRRVCHLRLLELLDCPWPRWCEYSQ